ncbi:MAG TPA: hypothetical protein DEG65_04780 [Methylophaga sp.]|jgi:hypothetical protein|nr:hypothetical protein [Methylophaga sp.]
MGLRAEASVNPTLTNYASGVLNDLQSATADFLAPQVQVPATIGQYKAYDDKNAFQTHDTSRGVGGPARRIFMDVSEPTYNCLPQALEITIDDSERDAAGTLNPLDLEQAKVKTLVQSSVLSHEKHVITTVNAAVAATGGVGVWSNDANDPVDEIDAQIEAIAKETGQMPNAILMGMTAWRRFRANAKVVAKQPGAALIGLNQGQASALLINPSTEIRLSTMAVDTTKQGKTRSNAFVNGDDVYIFVRSATPTIYDPSALKTFAGGRGGVSAVREYRDESSRSDVYAVDWSRDVKVTSAISIKRITTS